MAFPQAQADMILSPDPESDVTLSRVSAQVASNGMIHVSLSGESDEAETRHYVWTVDLPSQTYRIFEITDVEIDSRRISQYAQEIGRDVPTDNLRRALSDILEGPSAQSGAPPSPNDGMHALDDFCGGSATAQVTTYDPVAIELAKTLATAVWSGGPSILVGYTYPECWANASTPVGTSWQNTYCSAVLSGGIYASWFEYINYASYINWDFGDPQESTEVWSQVSVGFNSTFQWTHQHFTFGESSFLLWGSASHIYTPSC